MLELMKKAETIDEILQIQAQLTDVRYQLESMESQLRTYDNQITYSTVNMSIEEVIDYTPVAKQTFGERATEGFRDNLVAIGDFFTELALAFITHLPTIILMLIIIAVIVVIIRAIVKRHKKKLIQKYGTAQGYPMQAMPNVPVENQNRYSAAHEETAQRQEESVDSANEKK